MHHRSDELYKEIHKCKKFTREYEKKLFSSQSDISDNDGWETQNQTPTNSGEVRQSLKVPKDAARSTEHEKEEIETALMRNYQNSKKENKNVQMLLHYYMLKRRF